MLDILAWVWLGLVFFAIAIAIVINAIVDEYFRAIALVIFIVALVIVTTALAFNRVLGLP